MSVGLDAGLKQLLADQLQEAFPAASFDELDLEGIALALLRGVADSPPDQKLFGGLDAASLEPYREALDALAGLLPINAPATGREADPLSYYWVDATHTRQTPAGYQPFVGKLAMVRVSLPESEPRRFSSAIGMIEPSDHLISTRQEADDKYQRALGYSLARLDVITPPRQLLRFGAVSLYLGYRDADDVPSCFILEAGTALGQPKVLYLGKTTSTKLNRITGYKPTAFSCADNAYTGAIELDEHEPTWLHITARDIIGNHSAPPYIKIDARFIKQTGTAETVWPGFLITRAALIVLERKAAGLTNTCEDT